VCDLTGKYETCKKKEIRWNKNYRELSELQHSKILITNRFITRQSPQTYSGFFFTQIDCTALSAILDQLSSFASFIFTATVFHYSTSNISNVSDKGCTENAKVAQAKFMRWIERLITKRRVGMVHDTRKNGIWREQMFNKKCSLEINVILIVYIYILLVL